jgi:mono/diheme cytochrome c family protein
MLQRTTAVISPIRLGRSTTVAAMAILVCRVLTAAPAGAPSAEFRSVLGQYCVTCHNEKLHTAGLVLTNVDPASVGGTAALWEKVLDKVRTGSMPPAGAPRPSRATYDSLAKYIETELDRAAQAKPQAGHVAMHRLNRAEYANTVRDLLGLDIDVESLLPVDDSGYGFDNIADVLSVSPMLLNRYMSAARKISRLAVGDLAAGPEVQTYDPPLLLEQDHRMSEDLPLGSRGGVAIRKNFPVEGDYIVKVRLQRSGNYKDEDIMGLTEAHQIEIRLDGARVQQFTIGGKYADNSGRDDKGSFIRRATTSEESKYKRTADSALEVRLHSAAGPHLIGVDFVSETTEPEGLLQAPTAGFRFINKRIEQVLPNVATVIVEGPYDVKGQGDTPSRQKILLCHPTDSASEIPCAQRILSTLARRAYRRPVTDQDVQALVKLYKAGRNNGSFDAGIARAIEGILVYPEFLFRIEKDRADQPGGATYRISDLELSSRISFFLWSSIPDDELLQAAANGKLKDSGTLEHEVRRMLADSRSKALVSNFAGQWLYLRNIRRVTPDPEAFSEFDENLRSAFERETGLFLEENLRTDRGVLNLLDADYTFVNERLARFYGIPGIYGDSFRRVSLEDGRRRGLLGQGSILTVTSYPNRTSPTIRGKWLLENFLGTPPPPPPPNVPSLKEQAAGDGNILTMRQRMEEHRHNTACAVCHTRMDPLGFALENFDGIGKWRSKEGTTAIDASGVLPDGVKFNGPAELRRILLSQPEQFVTTVATKLMTYALGRGVEYYDAPAVRKIVHEATPADYRWSSLILGVIRSVPFQMTTVSSKGSQDQVAKVSKP